MGPLRALPSGGCGIKQELKAQCDLDKPMTLEEMEMLELIRRIGNDIFCLKILEGH